MDAKMKALDNKVAEVAANLDWPQWEMDKPTYKHPQVDFEIDASPGAREFHRVNHGNRDGTSIRAHHFWNGGHSFHPEEPSEWPGVTVRVTLPAERYDLQQRLAEGFRKLIEEVLNVD